MLTNVCYQPEWLSSNRVLAPNYLKSIPQCPANRRDTYSETYRKTGPEAFQVNCQPGHRKLNLPPGSPGWTIWQGLIEKP